MLPRMRSILCVALVMAALVAAKADYLVYVGTYTGAKSKGIYALRMNKEGKLSPLGLVAETPSPSFLAISPNQKYLYAVNEKNDGTVTAFWIEAGSGKLTLINEQPAHGSGPCHVSLDSNGKTVMVANYNSGSIAAYPVQKDGSLGEATTKIQHQGSSSNPQRQKGPHAHVIHPDPSNRYALVCDLGLDKVLVYRLDAAKASLTPNDPPFGTVKAGAGPRHLAFAPKGDFDQMGHRLRY